MPKFKIGKALSLSESAKSALQKHVDFFEKRTVFPLRWARPASKSIASMLKRVSFIRKLPFDPYRCNFKVINGKDFLVEFLRKHDAENTYIFETIDNVIPTEEFIGLIKSAYRHDFSEICNATLDQLYGDENHVKALDNVKLLDADQEIASEVIFSLPFYASQSDEMDKFMHTLANVAMEKYGYFLSNYGYCECDFHKSLKEKAYVMYVSFEPKYTTLNVKLESNLFHVTSESALRDIAVHGIVPKASSSEFKYPPRVYLFNKADHKTILSYGVHKAKSLNENRFYVIHIEKSKLESYSKYKSGDLTLYRNPQFTHTENNADETAIFTYGAIPASVLCKTVMKYDISNLNSISILLDGFNKHA